MSIFREYDIRGVVGKDLTVELAEKIGRAYGSRAVRAGAKAIAVGRDGRTSASVMREAVLKGLLGCGLDVVDIGICPTPLLYFALFPLPVGDGMGGLVGPDALRTLGCRVTGLYEEVDGRFPNHQPDPTVVANLQDVIRKVGETGADVGIAYDGDADRIGAVDEKGQILWGDKLMVLFSRDILKEKPGATILSEVKASQAFYDD